VVGTSIAPLVPTVTGTVTSYVVSPALPDGLSLDATTGVITGMPSADVAQANYTVTGQNTAGSTSFVLSITVHPVPPAAATVTVSYGVKQVVLNWSAVNGATYYKVLKNPDGHSGYSELATNLNSTSYPDVVAVHLIDWMNASYIVVSCNVGGCTNSSVVNSFDSKQAIGYLKASNTNSGDLFGYSVALNNDGTTLAIGAYGEASNATGVNGDENNNSDSNAGAVYIFVRTGTTWSKQAYLKASNTMTGMRFGASVTLSADGNTLVVGAPYESSNATGVDGDQSNVTATNAGAAYVFTRSGTLWSQQAYIKASNTINNSYFGTAVSLSADASALAVGAYGEPSNATGVNGNQNDNSAPHSGAVYVFTNSGSTWSQQAYIKASNTDAEDYFGMSVALSADSSTLAVGSYRESSNATGINGDQSDNTAHFSGAAYVFTRSGSTWTQQAYVKASTTHMNDYFGYSVALSSDGTTLAIGAAQEASRATGINGDQTDTLDSFAGAAYIFTRSGSTWLQQAYIKASNTDSLDNFGCALSLSADGNLLAVGAQHEASNAIGLNGNQNDNSANQAGAVYVFTRSGTTWAQRTYVKATNTELTDDYGSALTLSGDGNTLAVGAQQEASNATDINGTQGDNSSTDAGAVYLY
jgi:hypothetical protein